MSLFPRPRYTRNPRLALLGVLLLTVGCGTGIHVCRIGGDDPLAGATSGEWSPDVPSTPTLQALRQRGLEELSSATLRQLRDEVEREPTPDALFALAELSYRLGRRTEKHNAAAAASWYYLSAGVAYHFLFDPARSAAPLSNLEKTGHLASPFDSRFRMACELYKAALVQCLRTGSRANPLLPAQGITLRVGGKEVVLPVSFRGFPWHPAEFGPTYLCADFKTVGLSEHQGASGLGVPLIVTHQRPPHPQPLSPKGRGEQEAPHPQPLSPKGRGEDCFYPRGLTFPATALLHFTGTIGDLKDPRNARWELIDPLTLPAVEVCGQTVPVQSDLTTPLAYFMGHSPFAWTELATFLHADRLTGREGLYQLEPYRPGKIPLLLVHGILSSPMTWGSLLNNLRADPLVRQRYQIFVYYYPTGNHLLVTAAHLRQELARLHARVDPYGVDPYLNEMVVIGHSMGGIVAQLLTVNSRGAFWQLASAEPFEHIPVHGEFGQGLQQAFFFERQPAIKRVVLLATPNHGSKIIQSPPVWLLRPFMRPPAWLAEGQAEVNRANPNFLRQGALATTLDLLAPGSPFLEVLAAQPRAPDVHYHTIAGNAPAKPMVVAERLLAWQVPSAPGDGIVPCSSARLDGVDSERVVPAEHCEVLHHLQVVTEIRRILREHEREVDERLSRP